MYSQIVYNSSANETERGIPTIKFVKFWAPAILYMLLIVILSSMSYPPVPQTGWYDIDKLYHVIEYCALGFLMLWAFMNAPWKWLSNHAILLAILWTSFFGATDEIHQYFVPGRYASVFDWVCDTIGAIVGVFAMYILLRLLLRIRGYKKGERNELTEDGQME